MGPVLYKYNDPFTETLLVANTLAQAAGTILLLTGVFATPPARYRTAVALSPLFLPQGGYPGVKSDDVSQLGPTPGGGGGGGYGRIVLRTPIQPPGIAALIHPAAAYVPLKP